MNTLFNNKFAIITFTIILISMPIAISSIKVFYKPFDNKVKTEYIKQSDLKNAKTRLKKYKTAIADQHLF